MHKSVHNICKSPGIGILNQDIVDILKYRHFFVMRRIFGIAETVIIVSDALFVIGLDQGFI